MGGAEDLAREIEKSIALSPPKLISGKTWQRPVLIGEMERSLGVAELWSVISEHKMLRE